MTSPVDRAAEAPRILGVEMLKPHPGTYCLELTDTLKCAVRFTEPGEYYFAYVNEKRAYFGYSIGEAIAAIERELLAIKSAIPGRPACTNCGGRHTSTTDEETCFEARAAIPAPESKP